MRKRILWAMVAALAISLVAVGSAVATTTTVRVDGNGDGGWSFNGDPDFTAPYEFVLSQHSIGTGSMYVGPIPGGAGAKFTALHPVNAPVADFGSISYDFLLGSAGVAASPQKHFYLNVYTNLPGSTTFYDCRFDYVPTTGSFAGFTQMSVSQSTVKAGGAGTGCPSSLGGMPAGSTISQFALNVGDSGTGDTGVAGYYDNVVVSTAGGDSTVYDFEVRPEVKDACKDQGWATYGFPNQGSCVSYLQANPRALK